MKRIRRILLFASLATLSYFLLGLIINRIAPERLPRPEAHLAVGTVMESRQEGFRQVITRMEAGRIWTRLVLLPGALGPPEHVHTGFAEVFQVVEGTLSILYNGKVEMLQAGEELEIPAGVRHKPFNPTGNLVVIEGDKGSMPADFGLFLQQAHAFFDEAPANSRPPRAIFQMSLFSPRYDSWLAGPPIVLQRVFFALLAPTARLLGYRSFYEKYSVRQGNAGMPPCKGSDPVEPRLT